MDGVLVNNTRAHVRAFEIFCKRYGVEEWQRKLQTSFGMGNDDIMRQILPEEIIREKGLKALGEEKEAIYREVYAPEIRPVRGSCLPYSAIYRVKALYQHTLCEYGGKS